MPKKLNNHLVISQSGDEIPLQEVLDDERHRLIVSIDESHNLADLEFTTREAMYDFGRFLLWNSIYSISGEFEISPRIWDGKIQAVDGVRLDPKSVRLFIFCPEIDEAMEIKTGKIQ